MDSSSASQVTSERVPRRWFDINRRRSLQGTVPRSSVSSVAIVTSASTSRQRILLPYLSTVVLIEMALLLHLLRNDPVTMQRLFDPVSRWRTAAEMAYILRNDPLPGTPFTSSLPDVAVAALRSNSIASPKARYLIVFTGPCTRCNAGTMHEWQAAAREKSISLVFISHDSESHIKQFVSSSGFKIPILPDKDGQCARSFNAAWFARAYLLDAKLELIRCQKSRGENTIHEAAEFLQ